MLVRILHFFWLLTVSALFLAAVVIAVGRLWVPSLVDYRADLEELATDVLRKTVTIGRIEGAWRGLTPVLRLLDVAITEPGQPVAGLSISEIWIRIDAMNFLQERRLSLESIDVIGADVTVIRDPDGNFHISRMTQDSGDERSLADLFNIDRLSIHDSVITYEDWHAERYPVRFTDVTLTLDNTGEHPLLTGYVMLPPQLGHRVDVTAEIHETEGPPEQWGGRVYLKGHSLLISEENLRSIAADTNVSGTADLRCWVNLGAGQLKQVRGELEITALQLHQQGEDAGTDYAIDRFSGRFGWRKRPSGWQFTAQHLVVEQGADVREAAGVSIAQRSHQGDAYYSGEFTGLYLEDLLSVVRTAPGIPEAQRHRIARLQPEGLIEKFYIDVRRTGDRNEVQEFDMTFRDLGIRPADGPGFSGLRGSVTGTRDTGAIWLSARHAGFSDAGVFRDELRFDAVSGEIGWQWQDGDLAITGNALHVENADLALTGELDLGIPEDGATPVVDLQLEMHRGQLGRLRHYLPARVMPATGVAWLDRSLVSGDIRDGSVVLKGPLDKLPFDNGEGQLEVRLPVTRAVLDFNPDWTPIRGLAAQVNITGRSMDVVSRQGNIRTASLAQVNARIKDLAKPDLLLKGTVTGDLPVMLAELGSSPLGELYGGFVDRVTGTGKTKLDLDVFVPLHGKGREVRVKGIIHLEGSGLKVNASGIELDRIRGKLAFDSDGISGKDLQARMLGAPVKVSVRTEPQDAVTNISIRGPLDIVSIVADEQPALDGILHGNSDWDVQLRIARLQGRKETPDITLELASSLEGMAIDLPAPFGKAAADTRPLSVTVEQIVRPERVLRFQYAGLLHGILGIGGGEQGMALQQGNIMTGLRPVAMPGSRELFVGGRLERFSLAEWQPVFARFDGAAGPPVRLDLEIGTLELLQHVLKDVSLIAVETGTVQNFILGGPTVKGKVRLERGTRGIERVAADLKLLKLRRQADATDTATAADPNDFPELDIAIKLLKYEGMKLGKVQLQASTAPGVVQVSRFAVKSDMLSLDASGNWRAESGRQVSQFDIEVTDGKLEILFREFNYQEDVSGGDIQGSLRASWPGAPWALRPAVVDGKLYLLVQDGQLLNIKPGAGRVFGLVSLHTLPRRLSLDFDDLYKKGYTFDRIEGNFVLNDGDAFTSDLVIEGPAARIEISGRIGLEDEDYDELVTVVPHVGSSLPIAGVIAGGPIVGAALLVAEYLLGDELEKHTKFAHKQYTVTGPWADPVYTEVDIGPHETPVTESQEPGAFEIFE
ncbi:MAG: YhdP family protein [Thiohalobacterales bacterium]